MYPYKGKFHPKMVRALLNSIYSEDKGLVMDNYAGSGTLLVEANLMGLDAVGVEINPMSALMSQVKCDSLRILEPSRLKLMMEEFLGSLASWIEAMERGSPPVDAFDPTSFKELQKSVRNDTKRVLSELSKRKKYYTPMKENLTDFLVAKHLVERDIEDEEYRRFFLLALAGSISDSIRRKKASLLEILTGRLGDLYLRIYLFNRFNEYLKIDVGKGTCHTGDTRNMSSLEIPPVDGNVNSPPYSTALDYIDNDQPQLSILGLHPDLAQLVQDMVGFPRKNFDGAQLEAEIEGDLPPYSNLSSTARQIVKGLYDRGRSDAALRSYKFFVDTHATISEVHSLLKPGAKYAVVIGNNIFKTMVNLDVEEAGDIDYPSIYDDLQDEEFDYSNIPVESASHICVKNDQVYLELGEQIGFELDNVITRVLEKSSVGNIRYESIVILEKKA